MALIDDLISFYELEESSGTHVDSHGSNDLGDVNSPTSNPGKVGTSLQVSRASNQYLFIEDNSSLSTGDIDFTICAWVYLDSTGWTGSIVNKGNGSNLEYDLRLQDDTFNFYVCSTSSFTNLTNTTVGSPTTGQWYFLVAWHDTVNDEIHISLDNGTPTTVSYPHGTYDSVGDFYIGSNSFGEAFDGRIDQVGFWKRVLTSDERTSLYNGGNGLSYTQLLSGGAGGESDVSWSENFRRSVLGVGLPWNMMAPIPDGFINKVGSENDRKHIASYYRRVFETSSDGGTIYDLIAYFESVSRLNTMANRLISSNGRFASLSNMNVDSIRRLTSNSKWESQSDFSINPIRAVHMTSQQASHSAMEIGSIVSNIKEILASFGSVSDFGLGAEVTRPPVSLFVNMMSQSQAHYTTAQTIQVGVNFGSHSRFTNNPSRIITTSSNFGSSSNMYLAPVRLLSNGATFLSLGQLNIETEVTEYAAEIGVILNSRSDFKLNSEVISELSIVINSRSNMRLITELPTDLILTPVEFELLLTKTLGFTLHKGRR